MLECEIGIDASGEITIVECGNLRYEVQSCSYSKQHTNSDSLKLRSAQHTGIMLKSLLSVFTILGFASSTTIPFPSHGHCVTIQHKFGPLENGILSKNKQRAQAVKAS